MEEKRSAYDQCDEVYAVDSNSMFVMCREEIPHTTVSPETTKDQIIEFVKRALDRSPIRVEIEVGNPVRVLRPVSVSELYTANSGIETMMQELKKEECTEQVVLDEEKGLKEDPDAPTRE